MKSAKWMRTGVLVIALLAVAGVMAVLACGPSSAVPSAELIDEDGSRSALRAVTDAVDSGMQWVDAAGNDGDKHNLSPGALRLVGSGASGSTCDSLSMSSGENYTVQFRWGDPWAGAGTSFGLLEYPAGICVTPLVE